MLAILNLDKIRAAHKRLLTQTALAVQREMEEGGEAAVDYVKTRPTFTPRTGNLQKQTDFKTVRVRGGRVLKIRNKAKYAAPIDVGAGPHVITPKSPGGYLRFFWKKKNRWVTTKKVNHPGNRPYRFLRAAAGVAGSRMVHGIQERMHRIALKF